ncbi:hypothetical protein PPSIR1_35947 [Plesiocystis pacifica SIR-1]|uniref:Uncharacterized protein n=1 Tax=Plesiocystis pacifica SIR-1 TaxID=391625 RepID=A6G1W8_9BACT|nr:hypothetical protein [Plesiocystis pacifica]EDM80158.1 hypothetical protein PPSIR1_35947 [Plesiocystis pacifica SIR-1]
MSDNENNNEGGAVAGASASASAGVGAEAEASFSASIGLSSAEFDALWQEVSAKVETSFEVKDTDTPAQEAHYWDQLEHWLLKDYSRQIKVLGMQIARLELMMRTYNVALEARFDVAFKAWSKHFDERIDGIMRNIVREVVHREAQTILISQREVITNTVLEQIHERYTEIINKRVEERVLLIRDEIVTLIQTDLEAIIITKLESFSLTIQDTIIKQVITQISNEIAVLVKNEITEINIEQFIEVFRVEINRIQALVIEIENNLNVRIDHGDLRLRNWVIAQLLQIKGCLSDREVLAELFVEFSSMLRTRLDNTDCVDPNNWVDGIVDTIPLPPVKPTPTPQPPLEPLPPDRPVLDCASMRLVPETSTAGSTVSYIGKLPKSLRPEDVTLEVPGAAGFHPDAVEGGAIVFTVPEGAKSGTLSVTVGETVCRHRIVIVETGGPFVTPVPGGKGLLGNVYQLPTNTKKLPDFSALTPVTSVAVGNLDVPARDFRAGFPGVAKTARSSSSGLGSASWARCASPRPASTASA